MIDIFEEEIYYTDMYVNIEGLRSEVATLDDDSLIDELRSIAYILDEDVEDKINHLVFKNNSNVDFLDSEVKFLQDVYVTYYAGFAYVVDEEEPEDDED